MNIKTIPEFEATESALVDVIIRVQQCLIALDCYRDKLEIIKKEMPSLLTLGVSTRDMDMNWSPVKTPEQLFDVQRKSTQFILLSGVNMLSFILDNYMKMLVKNYWKFIPPPDIEGRDDETWFTPDAFEMITGIKLHTVGYNDIVDDIRRISASIKTMYKARTITVADFFDYAHKITNHMALLGNFAYKKALEDTNKLRQKEGDPPITDSSPQNNAPEWEEGEDFDGSNE